MSAGKTLLSERDYLDRRFGDLPAWAKDRITNALEVRLDFKERVLVLIGRPLMVEVNIECAVPPGRIESFGWAWAARWRWPWSPKGAEVIHAAESVEPPVAKCLGCPHPEHGLSGCVDGCPCTFPTAQLNGDGVPLTRTLPRRSFNGDTGWGSGE